MTALPLYKRLLGARYVEMPQALQRLHGYQGEVRYAGRCRVRRGNTILSRLCATILSLPPASNDADVTVHFVADGDKEIWQRRFNGKAFRSTQWQNGALLYERLNLTTLVFAVVVNGEMLDLVLQEFYILGIPMKRLLNPQVIARETERNGRFHFFVQTTLPLLGLLVEYEGELERVT